MKVAGYGFWIAGARGKRGGGGPIAGNVQDNNLAEAMAICNTLWHGVKENLIHKNDEVLIQSDSLRAVDFLSGHVQLKTDQEKLVFNYFKDFVKDNRLHVTYKHVKAHTGAREARFVANRMCDTRAKKGLAEARKTHQEENA